MGFIEDKKNILAKIDKSSKRCIDKDIKQLVDFLNNKPDYFTTSSCAGRILLISQPKQNKKYNVEWLYLSHDEVIFSTIKNIINEITTSDVWFKEESAILHVCCKTIEDASNLIETAKHAGFKRSGINTIGKRIMLELLSTENMAAPIIKDSKLIVDDDYIKILVDEANKKLKRTKEKINALYKILSSP
ncbi:MAG: tRNA wybutosine-synthesizing 3 family protein [Nanoarchaeota archaeon]